MKIKACFFLLACLVFGSCATSAKDKIWLKEPYSEEYIKRMYKPIRQQTLLVSDMTYDQVWDVCERTLIHLGFAFYKADKVDGEMRIGSSDMTDASTSSATQTPAWSGTYKLSVLVSKTEGQISVQVGFLEGANLEPLPSDITLADREVTRVIQPLKKKLGL